MKQYKLVNNLMGWLTFAIAAVVYCLTIEPSASFWDCPEFITTGYKLEVGHPPGAPFFMLVANLFSQLVSDPAQVARMVNTMSALLSAGCILFLFWTITHLTKKLICAKDDEMTTSQLVTIIGAGLVGALAYTFSDTFWYSAVEGEVYAFSSFFTAIVFWFILKWEDVADQPHSDRWIILIAYMIGLSVGVHLLNLLCIPAIVLVYYFNRKKEQVTFWGTVLALVISALLVAVVLYGIVPGIVKVGGWFELLFVNRLHMHFNTGLVLYIILLVASLVWSIFATYKKNKSAQKIAFLVTVGMLGIPFLGHGPLSIIVGILILAALTAVLFISKKDVTRLLNTSLLCLLVMVVGYSSYALIVIRSTANTPMDQNSPEDIFTLGDYLGREQYGSTPLFYGQTYASKVKLRVDGRYCVPEIKKGAPIYGKKEKKTADEKDSYVVVSNRDKYIYAQNMFFPRMYSEPHSHYGAQQINLYDQWVPGGIKGHKVKYDQCGEMQTLTIPTMGENLAFFFNYQVNYMYWRYFLWNFVGRQNDIQGNGELENGNWITGIKFIDNLLVGNQTLLPTELKENKGHNVFYGLPLLLGLIGLFWQAFRGKKGMQQFWIIFFLFFMTGLAIVLYLNQTPMQPRERDYAYAASFYAFTIWIGLSVPAVASWLSKLTKKESVLPAAAATVLCLLVPIQMGSQTWDDHDRSHRFMCRDFGQNYLNTLPDHGYPIIYTNGDNDTFPLWYNQETEQFRTDARVCNLSYLQTPWYIDQMRRPAYDSPSVPISWPRLQYVEGTNDYIAIQSDAKKEILSLYKQNPEAAAARFGEEPFELKNILAHWVQSENSDLHFVPTDSVYIKLDKAAILRSGMMIPKEYLGATDEETMSKMPDRMYISLKGKRSLYKNELMMLEMLAQCNWERPIFMAITVGSENHLGLEPYFVQEGLAYRLTPFNWQQLGYVKDAKREFVIDTEKMYDNLMNRFRFGNMNKEGIYLDETITRMACTHRRMFVQLADQLIAEGKNDKALAVLNKCEEELPAYNLPHSYFMSYSHSMALDYIELGEKEKGLQILCDMADNEIEYATWYLSLSGKKFATNATSCRSNIDTLYRLIRFMEEADNQEVVDRYSKLFEEIYQAYNFRMKG
ncbi:MAG: DUF2723 domain-containing protein [Bacteroidaceae bacterium]|nr:DUF2723 domain-containing protein [Bacteroidaceae bacterium]